MFLKMDKYPLIQKKKSLENYLNSKACKQCMIHHAIALSQYQLKSSGNNCYKLEGLKKIK